MPAETQAPTALKPGPPSLEDLLGRLDHALRHVHDRIELNPNPLTRLTSISTIALVRYSGRVHPRALALREVIQDAIGQVLADLEGEAGVRNVRAFLSLYGSGITVAAAARKLGLSREHCSRSVKRKALLLVSEKFAQLALERRHASLASNPALLKVS